MQYRSRLEERIAARCVRAEYEPKSSVVSYSVPHKYHPDFVYPNKKYALFEVKGHFATSAEATKYIHIREANPEKEIIFIFANSDSRVYPHCRVRRDGSRQTLGEWAARNGFLYYDESDLPPEIEAGTFTRKFLKAEKERKGVRRK